MLPNYYLYRYYVATGFKNVDADQRAIMAALNPTVQKPVVPAPELVYSYLIESDFPSYQWDINMITFMLVDAFFWVISLVALDPSSILNDSSAIGFVMQWTQTWLAVNTQLWFFVLLDQYINWEVVVPYISGVLYSVLMRLVDIKFYYSWHWELTLEQNSWLAYYFKFTLNHLSSQNNLDILDNVYFVVMTAINFLIVCGIVFILATIIISFFGNATKEEATIDHDYLNSGLLTEAEKELGALDDFFFIAVFCIFIFGWYFYTYCCITNANIYVFAVLFTVFPMFYVLILVLPAMLLYEFGVYFIAYVRGGTPSPVVISELLFDYVAVFAFFLRVFVQNVRFLSILFVIHGFNELILFHGVTTQILGDSVRGWYKEGTLFSFDSWNYMIVVKLSLCLLHFLYELYHTLFVVLVQITAFLAMVFWLFSFLYTYFVMEVSETYFKDLRQRIRSKIKA